ncbi:MAG: class I SAM-dependent methyltransferase [Sphingomonas sanxanigenens]|uniref:Class I SAM-dependent methyltransferase n=1 Tax=Sphingomonas sanxanigenens TaxID=397260 RepID=A0A2W5AF02_9SPHN|nr:MAG: class I SAM-dependent methyltransferase [Sphingomonas sanxanigenens]
MTTMPEALADLLAASPATREIVGAVLADWPDHAAYLTKSFAARSPEQMAATEEAATAALRLIGDDAARFAHGYHWTCDRLRDEELFFHREGRYRLSTFAEADAEVYSNHDYMTPYVDGLLLTQILWYNHVATFEMFLNRVLGAADKPFSYLEVGPGHGLMVYCAARSPLSQSLEAWDVSPVSLRETRAALDRLGVDKPVSLVETDILQAVRPDKRFDLIVISEVLEHLERPQDALAFLRDVIAEDGRIFINVPLNSPSPDHIYLLSTPEEARALVEEAGFAVDTIELYATQGRPVEKAVKNKVSVSVGMIARPVAGAAAR